jgi:hypothetical protein
MLESGEQVVCYAGGVIGQDQRKEGIGKRRYVLRDCRLLQRSMWCVLHACLSAVELGVSTVAGGRFNYDALPFSCHLEQSTIVQISENDKVEICSSYVSRCSLWA